MSAINILTKALKQHFEHDLNIVLKESEKEYRTNQNALMYSIQLVSDDLIQLSGEYYKSMTEETYQK